MSTLTLNADLIATVYRGLVSLAEDQMTFAEMYHSQGELGAAERCLHRHNQASLLAEYIDTTARENPTFTKATLTFS